MQRPLVAAILALAITLAGCLGAVGDEIVEPNARDAPGDEAVPKGPEPTLTDLTYEPIETVRVNFPLGPTDPAPTGPVVDVPDDTAALKFEIRWHSTTGNMVWSSYTPPPPATESVGIRVDWPDGDHATTIEMGTSLHVDVPPTNLGGAFETQRETLPLDPARGGTLNFSPAGWGDLWAIVEVSAGHP